MTARVSYDDVEVGARLPAQSFPVRRLSLVMYAGASGDFNRIHWNERFARAVGLPDVIAHGMFTMAQAGRVLTDWAGDPAAVLEYGVRFTKPVVVPDGDDGTSIDVEGEVVDKLDDRRVRVQLTARCGADKVLAQARAVLQLA
jgi:acyl dehydratase